MKRTTLGLTACAILALVAMPLHAQSGCTDSPENPTVVLGLVGGAGGLLSALRAKINAKRRKAG